MASTSNVSQNYRAKTFTKNSKETGASSRVVANLNSTKPKKKTSTQEFSYEIDCQRVSDSVKASDLVRINFTIEIHINSFVIFTQQNYLEKQLKLNGEKNNLGDNITVCCQDWKVVIRSEVYIPKRSLRFLSKKFLKKIWNVQKTKIPMNLSMSVHHKH